MSTPERQVLLEEGKPPVDTPTTPAPSPAQIFAARHRPGYARVPSVSFNEDALARDMTDTPQADETVAASKDVATSGSHGLGITNPMSSTKHYRISTPPLRESGTFPRPAERTPSMGTPLMSAPSTGGLSGSTRFNESFGSDTATTYKGAKNLARESRTSLQSGAGSTYARSDAGLLSIHSRYQDFQPHHNCQTARSVKRSRFNNWVSVTIIFLAVFSTLFSAIFLIIALTGPRYGRQIRKGGRLTPSSAAFLTSFFAKLIELSFVTVVVAFVGQALARRAFKKERPEGVTLAEMSMRNWINAPGTMLTQWESVRYAGLSILGMVSLLAALMAILYTSAATALVQPQLKYPGWEHRMLSAPVKTQYANSIYIKNNCKMPITTQYDASIDRGSTCTQMQHASYAYHNYYSYISDWTDVAASFGNGSIWLPERLPGYALLNDNTTIRAPWVDVYNVTHPPGTNFYVNNVTMAMPHVGVVQAAMHPANQIMQPDDVEGAQYNIIASVPSPIVNVLCVTMARVDLEPFVYTEWLDRDRKACNETSWTDWPTCLRYRNGTDQWLNQTETLLGKIFRWGEQYGPDRWPPVFQKVPRNYNTLLNETKGLSVSWGSKSIYLLLKGGDTDVLGNPTTANNGTNYAMCQMSAGLTPNCTTHYNASSSGGKLDAICETNERLQYNNSVHDAVGGMNTLSADWPNLAADWARSLSLSAGINDANASNARVLSQFIVTSGNLSAEMPSTAEALAALSGSTLVQSITDAPFVMSNWNHTLATVDDAEQQWFNATLRVQQYASGGNQDYQKPFYIVLFVVVIMNIVILIYFLVHRDWYTDFSQPEVLFALAVNSPPSEKLAGSCGCGPAGEQYKVNWKLNNDDGHYYMESQEAHDAQVNVDGPRLSRQRFTQSFEMLSPSVKNRFSMGRL